MDADQKNEARIIIVQNGLQENDSLQATMIYDDAFQLKHKQFESAININYLRKFPKSSPQKIATFPHLLNRKVLITGFGRERDLKKLCQDLGAGLGAILQNVTSIQQFKDLLNQNVLIVVHQAHFLLKLFQQLTEQEQQITCNACYSIELLFRLASISSFNAEMLDNVQFKLKCLENTTVYIQNVPKFTKGVRFTKFDQITENLKFVCLRDDKPTSEQLQLLKLHFIQLKQQNYNTMIPLQTKYYRTTLSSMIADDPVTPSSLFGSFPKQFYLVVDGFQNSLELRKYIDQLFLGLPTATKKIDEFFGSFQFVSVQKMKIIPEELYLRTFYVYSNSKVQQTQMNTRSFFWFVIVLIQFTKQQQIVQQTIQTQLMQSFLTLELANKVLTQLCSNLHSIQQQLQIQNYNIDVTKLIAQNFVALNSIETQIIADQIVKLLNLDLKQEIFDCDHFEFLKSMVVSHGDFQASKEVLKGFEVIGEITQAKKEKFSLNLSKDQSFRIPDEEDEEDQGFHCGI